MHQHLQLVLLHQLVPMLQLHFQVLSVRCQVHYMVVHHPRVLHMIEEVKSLAMQLHM